MESLIEFLKANQDYLIPIAVLLANFILANMTEIKPGDPKWKKLLIKLSNYIALNFSKKAGK